MNKLSGKQIQLVVGIIAILFLLVVFKFAFCPLSDKVDAVNSKNSELTAQLEKLKGYKVTEQTIRNNIAQADQGIQKIADEYAASITPEKSIKFIKDLENDSQIVVNSVSFNDEANIYSSTFVNDDGTNVLGSCAPLNITFTTAYSGLRECMSFINKYQERINVNEFSAAYNQETGLLSGTMIINQYTISGLGKTYEAPVINDIQMSTDNMFGTSK